MRRDEDSGATDSDVTAVAAPAALRRTGKLPSSIHEEPTHALPPTRSLAGTGHGSTGVTGLTTATTPLEALRMEELGRTRIFLKLVIGIVCFVGVSLPFVGGDDLAKKIVYGGLALGGLSAGWALYRVRIESGFNLQLITPVAVCLVFGAFTGVFYFGIFSGAPALVVLGIYFFSLGASPRVTLAIYALCAACQLALTMLITQGVIADRGLIRADSIELHEQLAIQAIIQLLYFSSFWIGRRSRRSTLDAIAQLERAVRSVAQREALLLEARQDLDRALRIGGPGRYSDQRVGSYTLGVLIGRGGMGEVYQGRHVDTDDEAAVKLLHLHVQANDDHVRRFVRETELAGSIQSPHVVRVLEVGYTEGEVPYLAMERLRGRDLAHHLRKHRRLSVNKAVTLVREIGAGLEAARAAGIVHRDIKPQNLFLAQVGNRSAWKILDFGVSKLADHSGTLTKGHVVGTPTYMAPEQAQGGDVDYRADVYGLGAIAFRALTGHPPYSGKDLPTTLYEVVYSMPPRPSALHDSLTEEIDLVLAIALAKKPEDRFASGAELADALAAAADSKLDPEVAARAKALLAQLDWGGNK